MLNFYPTRNFRNLNKEIEFNIELGNTFCTFKFQYFISEKLTKPDGGNYAETDKNIKLIYSFISYLFSWIKAWKHNKLLDGCEYRGVLSTVEETITYPSLKAIAQKIGRFESNYTKDNFFKAVK